MNCLDREIEAAVLLTVPIAPKDDSHVPMLRAMLTAAHERDAHYMLALTRFTHLMREETK